MSEGRKDNLHEWVRGNVPIVVALALTCVVVAIAASIGHRKVLVPPQGPEESTQIISRWDWFFSLPPNAMGDTIAGILGALTLIWIIASVFHQSKELADQREIMRLQRDEAELQRIATQEMADALAAQVAALRYERTLREEFEAKGELDELIVGISEILRETQSPRLEIARQDAFGKYTDVLSSASIFPPTEDKDSAESVIRSAFRHSFSTESIITSYLRLYEDSKLIVRFPENSPIVDLHRKLDDVLKVRSRVSAAQQVRIERLSIEKLLGVWERVGISAKVSEIELSEES